MGYRIAIGQAVIDASDPEVAGFVVEVTDHPDAPLDQTNVLRSAYAEWEDFLLRVGLHEVFVDNKIGIMREHPGIEPLTWVHYQQINEAYLLVSAFTDEGDDLARFTWLRFWVRWARKICDTPCIENG